MADIHAVCISETDRISLRAFKSKLLWLLQELANLTTPRTCISVCLSTICIELFFTLSPHSVPQTNNNETAAFRELIALYKQLKKADTIKRKVMFNQLSYIFTNTLSFVEILKK